MTIFDANPTLVHRRDGTFRLGWHRTGWDHYQAIGLLWKSPKREPCSRCHFDGCRAFSEKTSDWVEHSLDTREDGAGQLSFWQLFSRQLACRKGARHCRFINSKCFSSVLHVRYLPISFSAFQRTSDGSARVTTLLQAVHISLSHKANVLFAKDDVVYIRRLAWLPATVQHLRNLGLSSATIAQEKWSAVACQMQNEFGAAFFSKHTAWVREYWHSILDRNTDNSPDAEVPDFITRCPFKLSSKTFSALHDVNLGTFMEESTSTVNADRNLRTPKINTGRDAKHQGDTRANEPCYTCSK